MNIPHEDVAEIVRWMLSDGRGNTRAREFGAEICRRIYAAGIPIWRGFCFVYTLYPKFKLPLIAGTVRKPVRCEWWRVMTSAIARVHRKSDSCGQAQPRAFEATALRFGLPD
jgi:hypothetical protein